MTHTSQPAINTMMSRIAALELHQRRPGVGAAALVLRGDELLMGLRQGAHGAGCWSVPGGHVEHNEALWQAVRRELLEETGIVAGLVVMLPHYTFVTFPHRSYVTAYGAVRVANDTPLPMPNSEMSEWRWVKRGDVPTPIFAPFAALIDQGVDPWSPSGVL